MSALAESDLIDVSPRPAAMPHALASLIVVARHLGLNLKPEDLGYDPAAAGGFVSNGEIVARGRRCGLVCRPGRPSWAQLVARRNPGPTIVRLTDGSSMVLLRIDVMKGSPFAILEDPTANRDALLILDRRRFLDAWSGDVITVERQIRAVDETVPFGYPLIAKLILAERRMVVELAVAAFALSILAIAPIVFLRLATSRVLEYKSLDTLYVLSAIMLVLIAVETGLGAARRYISERLSVKVDIRLSTLLFTKVLRLPIEHFEIVPAGETIYMVSLLSRIRQVLVKVLDLVLDGAVLIIFVPVMFSLSPIMTTLILVLFGASILWIVGMMPRFRAASAAAEGAESRKGFFLYQTMTGIRTVKSLALDARQRHGFTALAQEAAQRRLDLGDTDTVMQTVMTLMQRLMMIGTMAGGAYLAIQPEQIVSVSTLIAFIMLTQRVASPLGHISELMQSTDEARLYISSIGRLANQPIDQDQGRELRTPIRGHVVFDNVEFRYRGANSLALRRISFEVPHGMTIGVMGRSGSGKTTITRLLQRLHSDYHGSVTVDGIDVRDYDVDHLRSNLGVVLQENFLFSGTIRDNITAAKADATLDEVVRAARLAGAEEFIDKLPRGYDTVIYEGSPNLSGGQRQRLAIARALITDPKILILDEATSALDAESEAIVNANLASIAHGRTMIVVSHRLSSLVSADAIMVLDRGEVNDIGKHAELLERCDIYSGLWYHQNPHNG